MTPRRWCWNDAVPGSSSAAAPRPSSTSSSPSCSGRSGTRHCRPTTRSGPCRSWPTTGSWTPRPGSPPIRADSTPGWRGTGWRCSASCRARAHRCAAPHRSARRQRAVRRTAPVAAHRSEAVRGRSALRRAQHLLNCDRSLQADPIGLLTEVAELAGLDAERVRRWLFARCVQEILDDAPTWPGLDVVLAQARRRGRRLLDQHLDHRGGLDQLVERCLGPVPVRREVLEHAAAGLRVRRPAPRWRGGRCLRGA